MPEETSFVDYYQLLGVPINADEATIRRTFISKAKHHHPDVGGSTESMQLFTRAYRTLMNQSSRRAYNLVHSFQTGTSDVQYHIHGAANGSATASDLTDEEIDAFLDKVYTEYRSQSKPKQSFIDKIKKAL